MASKKLFSSTSSGSGTAPQTNTVNDAGGKAYKMTAKHALAQYAVTNTFSDGFYKTGEDQLESFVKLLSQTDVTFAAKVAIYAHQKGLMKDAPSAILAHIASKDGELLKKVFSKVVTNAKMLRNFVQMIRSGKFSRKSFGNVSKKLIQKWFDGRSDEQIFNDAIGNDPSLADIIKMVHPKPKNKTREALYAYILGNEVSEDKLPAIVREFEAFKRGELKVAPEVSFQRLTALSVMSNAKKLSGYGGGGTDCGCAMKAILNDAQKGDVADVVLFVSDSESFYNENPRHRGTEVSECWNKLRKINPKAKMVCIDLIANETTQIVDSGNVLNIGGFGGDAVFEEIERFVNGVNVNSWVEEIEKIEI